MPTGWIAATLCAALAAPAHAAPPAGTHGQYLMLTCKPHTPPPLVGVDVVYGPREQVEGGDAFWWELRGRGQEDGEGPLYRLQALTDRDPLALSDAPLRFHRYILSVSDTGEALEYRNIHTGAPLLPPWRDFHEHFLPHRTRASREQGGLPETCTYLGHVLMLRQVGGGVPWEPLEPKVLELDPELLVGTSRSFRDAEGHRLPQEPERQNYTYVQFTAEDYAVMLEAGINLFTIRPEQEEFVRAEPVFYLRRAAGDPALRYPADLYRANYIGAVMFMDEPSIIMVGDELIHRTLRYFSDAAAVIEKRVRQSYRSSGNYGAFRLEKELLDRGVNFGDMRLDQYDYPSWETLYDTAFYQMRSGTMGIVHEGRYQLAPFDKAVAVRTGLQRRHTPEELLRYHYAFLRGGARPFDKYWGTAIYGQCDPEIAPLAMTLAYDMGARYIWFWTSDHDHHVPWPEQLELTRHLRRHIAANPRPPLMQEPLVRESRLPLTLRSRVQGLAPTQPIRDLAIAIPDGYFLSVDDLWWVRVLDAEGKNEASQRYRRLMRRAHQAIHDAFDRKLDFDITVDDGRAIEGYRQVIRVTDD